MITLLKQKPLWNLYISKDEHNYHRRDCGIDTFKSTFLLYVQRNDWKIVASLEHITEEEKEALFGFVDDKHVGTDRVQSLVNRLNHGEKFNVQRALEEEYCYVACELNGYIN